MKFGTIDDGTRDGRLVLVSPDNMSWICCSSVAPNLQSLLDDWSSLYSKLEKLNQDFRHNANPVESVSFLSPLPRAYEWIDGSAFINHIELVRKARGADLPPTLKTEPLVYQGGSGSFLSPFEDIPLVEESWGLDFESEVCVVLGDTPMGVTAAEAHKYVKLIMIANDVSLRGLIPGELSKGFGFFNSKPSTAFSPFCVTPDELGGAWREGRLHLPVTTMLNGQWYGSPDAGEEMFFSFFELIEHICKTRRFTAGTILGSGTVSNRNRDKGSSCLAEQRMIEQIDKGEVQTPFLRHGDHVQIEVVDQDGFSPFGMIDQKVARREYSGIGKS